MNCIAKFLASLAIMILLTSSAQATSEKVLLAKRFITPPRMRQFFPPSTGAPRKEYFPRQSFRPTPRNLPRVPQPSNDNRGGKRKNFGPPQTPHK